MKDEAARLTSLVLAHPASAQHSLFGDKHLHEEAELLRKELEADLPAKVDETALPSD